LALSRIGDAGRDPVSRSAFRKIVHNIFIGCLHISGATRENLPDPRIVRAACQPAEMRGI
jgi:hypothetical protein